MGVIMREQWRIFWLLMQKNNITRKRFWFATSVEILLPILYFLAALLLISLNSEPPISIEENTYHEMISKDELIKYLDRQSKLYYMPQNNFTNEIMRKVQRCLMRPNEGTIGFKSEDDMLKSYTKQQIEDQHSSVLAIVFGTDNGGTMPKKLVYTIRTSNRLPHDPFSNSLDLGNTMTNEFISNVPFVTIQMCVDESFIKMAAGKSDLQTKVSIQEMPYPPHKRMSKVYSDMKETVALGAFMAFLFIPFVLPSFIASEKNIGMNALMAINGVRSFQNLLSWQIHSMSLSLVYVTVVAVLFKVTLASGSRAWLYYGDFSVFWLLLFMNVAHIISFCLHIGTYFSRPLLAVGVAAGIYFIMIKIGYILEEIELHAIVSLAGILVPSIATCRMFNEFAVYENKMIGAQWNNIFEAMNLPFEGHGSLGYLMISSIIGIIFHFLLAVYISFVFPGKYGVRKHPLFFLKWFGENKVHHNDEAENCTVNEADTTRFEAVADGTLIPGIRIRKMRKTYGTSGFRRRGVQAIKAVKGITLDIFKGQISALLGPNGAGKTTTMSILTGLTGPSSGTVYINGRNVTDLDAIRDDISLCPQENMLFPHLTVFEQILFFGLLKRKNLPRIAIEKEVELLMEKLSLSKKKDVLPAKLSGGQKRRVCLGMAIIGNASVLILDEPTSGMDPETRRETWDIILRLRNKQRTIIISSHSMEEADILGDRIAIMCDGKMKCYGSSMFLKKLYGDGCHKVTLSTEPKCDLLKIERTAELGAQLQTDYGKTVFNVPYTSKLPEALDKMESEKEELGITGIGVSMITLEQVFLQVLQGEEGDSVDGVDEVEPLINAYKPRNKLSGWEYSKQVFYALLAKKAVYTRTNMTYFWTIVLGPLMTINMMLYADYVPQDSTAVHPLDLSVYRYPAALLSSEDHVVGQKYKDVIEQLHGTVKDIESGTNFSQALLSEAERNIADFHSKLIISAEFESNRETVRANGFYSSIAALSAPITVNVLSNTLLKTMAGDEYTISVNSQSFPNILESTMTTEALKNFNCMTKSYQFVTLLVLFTALFVVHPLLENITLVKQLQLMTGVTSFCYWGTMFLFDCLVFVAMILVLLLGHYVMDIVLGLHLYRGIEIGIIALILLLFAVNVLPLVYIHSFGKKSIIAIGLTICVLPIITAIFEVILFLTLKNMEGYEKISLTQQRIFSLVPQVSLALGLVVFFGTAAENARCRRLPNYLNEFACIGGDKCCGLKCRDGYCEQQLRYFTNFEKDSGLEEFLLYLALTSCVLFFILWMLECNVIERLKKKMCTSKLNSDSKNMDDEVRDEKQTVACAVKKRLSDNNYEDENILLVHELRKYYGKLKAVKEVNFAIKKHECFGLLGVNGAGKSSTFRMLTGAETPSSGILVMGYDNIEWDRKKYLSRMGYCPQTDALIPSLNAWEHLRLIALLRGVPKSDVKKEVQQWINALGLTPCARQPSGTYSGGNKRRLNVAMALIASPEIVLLDEPTTGVDPAARRLLWRVLQCSRAAGQAIILTSHSMEECEALCNRLVIMVEGQLMCIGASPHLKQRFGAGYDIEIKLNLKRSDEDVKAVKKDIEAGLQCKLRDEHSGLLSYHVIDANTTWQKMFGTMNDLQTEHSCIEDFSVTSATLEQLLIKFAKAAKRSESGTGSEHLVPQNSVDIHGGELGSSSFRSIPV